MSDLSPLSPSDSESSLSSCSSLSDSGSDSAAYPPEALIINEDLPLPTAPRPSPTKKSHARKQPLGHIPRPRNAFILFRCDYTRQKQRALQEFDQNYVSRLVGDVWRKMTAEQREPWIVMADIEKKKHAAMYPGYKYNPKSRSRGPPPTQAAVERQLAREAEKVVSAEVAKRLKEESKRNMVTVYYPPWATRRTLTFFARRAASCPPPDSIGVEPYSEKVDRAMVTINASEFAAVNDKEKDQDKHKDAPVSAVQSAPSSPTSDVFVPYDIHVEADPKVVSCPPSGRVMVNRLLSRCLYTIDPPGGTSSWGTPTPSSESPSPQHVTAEHGFQLFAPRPLFYGPHGEFLVRPEPVYVPQPYYYTANYPSPSSPETPSFDPTSPSAIDSSSSSQLSPTTPRSTFAYPPIPVRVATACPSPENAAAQYREFVSEFGNMYRPLRAPWGPYYAMPNAGAQW